LGRGSGVTRELCGRATLESDFAASFVVAGRQPRPLRWSTSPDGVREARGLRSNGRAGAGAYGVGSPSSWLMWARSRLATRASAIVNGGDGAHRTRQVDGGLRVSVDRSSCTLLHRAFGSARAGWLAWQRQRGLAAAVILCSGAQEHGRQALGAQAARVELAIRKTSRSASDNPEATTKRES
jgi:hypothetical protein